MHKTHETLVNFTTDGTFPLVIIFFSFHVPLHRTTNYQYLWNNISKEVAISLLKYAYNA